MAPRIIAVPWLAMLLYGPCLAEESVPKARVVVIAPNAIFVPTGLIVLARKHGQYCAIKILSATKGPKEGEWDAQYESYSQDDASGSFANKTARYRKGKLWEREVGGFGHLTATNRSQETIFCGKGTKKNERMWLQWSGGNWVYPYVYYDRDKSVIALAPTKWTDIAEVNFLDPRLTWYAYDEQRKKIEVPVEKLW